MSTISDALKKAQKQRAGQEEDRWHAEPLVKPLPEAKAGVEPVTEPAGPPVAGMALALLAVVLVISIVMMRCSRQAEAPKPEQAVAGKAREVPVVTQTVALAASQSDEPVKAVAMDREQGEEAVKEGGAAQEAEPVVPPHKLVGIFYADKNPIAIIDDFSLKEGETVGSYRVIRIEPESVTLQRSGEREVVLRLK